MTNVLEIKDSPALEKICAELISTPPEFIALDTEFMREKTYWPKLCLIQIAWDDRVVLIDPLPSDMNLDPFFEVMKHPQIVKVFHSARQDLEIFDHLMGQLPSPIFDTQVAAMVCGFRESVGYDTLVAEMLGKRLDKSSQRTNWMARPLTKNQWKYAIDDVVYLKELYKILLQKLQENKRGSWIEEEMRILTASETYHIDPQNVWKRLKVRTKNPRSLARLQAVAAVRENEAQRKDLPRLWVLRDELIFEIIGAPAKDLDSLRKLRGGQSISPPLGHQIIEALKAADAVPEELCPIAEPFIKGPPINPILPDILRLLLRYQCHIHHVAERIIASASDLEELARYKDKANVRALTGWRFQLFGRLALDLLQGKLNLRIKKNHLEFFE